MTRLNGERFIRLGLGALGVVLTAFHLLLLAARVVDGSVLDPAIAVEWILGLVLLAGLLGLRRAGVSVVSGRPALVLWVFVLLLHALAFGPVEAGTLEVSFDQNIVGMIPAGLAFGAAITYLAGAALLGAPRYQPGALSIGNEPVLFLIPSSSHFLSPRVPRAPPAPTAA